MSLICLTLRSLPTIGFAHHFYAEKYQQSYGLQDNSFEIVYVKSGKLAIVLGDTVTEAIPGSIFILNRQLPIKLYTMDDTIHSHCSIQICADFSAEVLAHWDENLRHLPHLLLPMVLPPCEEAERFGQKMYQIIANLQADRTGNHQSCALTALGILGQLDHIFRQQISSRLPSSVLLGNKMAQYIDSHLREDLTLNLIASAMGKSPNYLNAIFKQTHGMPIRQYINKRKAELIAQLMINKDVSFQIACENAAIDDISYGYRLFKKHMGVTPQQYAEFVHRN